MTEIRPPCPRDYLTPRIITYPVMNVSKSFLTRDTPNRWQSKTRKTIDRRGSKTDRNSVLNRHLSPFGPRLAIENSDFNYFDLRSPII